jgi:phosphatidylinositol alpha-1,6-mannosyltransferase
MYLIVTRSFPPELGGMQSLMWGLARELSKNFMIKVFADYIENHKEFDEQATFLLKELGDLNYLENIEKPI